MPRGKNRYPRRANRPEGLPYTWPRITLEGAMIGPCKWHSEPGKPAEHTTASCSWTGQVQRGLGMPPPPPGGNDRDNRGKRPADASGGSRDNFPNRDATYVISVIERNDKRS